MVRVLRRLTGCCPGQYAPQLRYPLLDGTTIHNSVVFYCNSTSVQSTYITELCCTITVHLQVPHSEGWPRRPLCTSYRATLGTIQYLLQRATLVYCTVPDTELCLYGVQPSVLCRSWSNCHCHLIIWLTVSLPWGSALGQTSLFRSAPSDSKLLHFRTNSTWLFYLLSYLWIFVSSIFFSS